MSNAFAYESIMGHDVISTLLQKQKKTTIWDLRSLIPIRAVPNHVTDFKLIHVCSFSLPRPI